MFTDPRNKQFDFHQYSSKNDERIAYYGLPNEVQYCNNCVISNQRPNSAIEFKNKEGSNKETIKFLDDGRCDACLSNEHKQKINWTERENLLLKLCEKYRRNDGHYDCLIPGSGGKDSFYQAHILKYKYGMNPLTVTWAPHLYTDWGRRNHEKWIGAGFDNYLITPNSRVHRLLTRIALEKLFHPFQPFMIGQKFIAPKLASLFDIPLIFYGENEAEYGNPSDDNNQSTRSTGYFATNKKEEIYISGVPVNSLINDFGLTLNDLDHYMPMSKELVSSKSIEVHYLGYFLKWHPQEAYYYACEHGNFEASPERTPGTYSKYNSIDDKIDDFHYYTTYIKFGLGRASYDASQEIRSGDIEREEGVALVHRFDGEYPTRFEDEIFDYLSVYKNEFANANSLFEESIMSRDYFNALTNKFRSPHLWNYDNGVWTQRYSVS